MNLQFTLAARYLSGRKLRTFLTTLAVVFGVLVIFGMNIILPTMIEALQVNAMAASGQVDVTVTHVTGDAFPQDMLAKVQAVDGVRAASAYLNRTVNLPADFFDHDPAKPDAITTLALIGLDPQMAKTVRSYPVTEGRFLQEGDGAVAVISQSLADALGVKLGNSFPFPTVNGVIQLKVIGLQLPRTQPGNEEVLVTLPQAQEMTGQPGKINAMDINLNSTDEARRAEIASNIQAALGEDYKIGTLDTSEEMFATLKMGQAAFNLFGVLALFMGAFIIFNTFRTIVVERRRDIGMLRAIGASRSTIIGVILVEGLLQGIIGTATGLLLGYLLGAGVLILAQGPMSQFINLRLGAPVITPTIVVTSIVLGVGVTVFAGLIPAINASKVQPLEALRPSLAETEYKRHTGRGFVAGLVLIAIALLALFSKQVALVAPSGILFLVGLVLVAPALVRPFAVFFGWFLARVYARQGTGELAQGNLTRQPSRVAITASATMLGLAIVVAAGALTASLTVTLNDLMKKNLGSDYLFVPPSIALWSSDIGAQANFADSLRNINGVGEISTLRFAASSIKGLPVSLMGIDPQAFPKVSGLHFLQGNASAYQAIADGRTMIANGAFMTTFNAKVGDTIELLTPNGKVPYRIVAVATDLLNTKVTTAYISQANMKADFGRSEDVFIQLNLKPNANASAVEPQIKAVAAAYPQFRMISGKAYYETMKAQIDAAFIGVYFLLALLALPSLIAMLNTLAIGVIERTREIGMLRAVGATRPQVRAMILSEALLLAAIGTLFGLLAGQYLGYVFVNALAPIFPLGYTFPVAGNLAAILIGLSFGLLAALIPARQAARLDVVQALRYE